MGSANNETKQAAGDDGVHAVSAAGRVEHLSTSEQAARGKAARADVLRSADASWEPDSLRADPVDLLDAALQTAVASGRVDAAAEM